MRLCARSGAATQWPETFASLRRGQLILAARMVRMIRTTCLDIEHLFEFGFSVAQSTVGMNRDGPVSGPDAEER